MPVIYKYRGTISINGEVFELLQCHYHSPSEHRIDNRMAPVEVHFVHANDYIAPTKLAVIGVKIQPGNTNALFNAFNVDLLSKKNTEMNIQGYFDLEMLLPEDRS